MTVKEPCSRIIGHIATFRINKHSLSIVNDYPMCLPDNNPTGRRQVRGVAVGGVLEVDERFRCVCDGAVRERPVAGTQDPKLVSVKVHGMAHLT